jgi:ABC-type antimicrobial peptide transport system permease subunit
MANSRSREACRGGPTDLTVFSVTAMSVVAVALIASYLPARSAGRVDPMLVLRDT